MVPSSGDTPASLVLAPCRRSRRTAGLAAEIAPRSIPGRGLLGSVDVGSGCHSHHGHGTSAVVYAVEDAVGPPACAMAIVERGHEPLANAVGVGKQGSVDELMCGEGDTFWELFRELPTRGRSDRQPIVLLGTHAVVLR